MTRLARFLGAVLLSVTPITSHAVAVTSPANLGPADFWVWIEATNGAFNRVEERDTSPVSLDLTDPVIGGATLSGHLIVSNEVLPTGPATVANAVLSHPGPTAIDTELDLRSLVTFDVAVLGSALSAQVRVQGSGVGGAAHGSFGPARRTRAHGGMSRSTIRRPPARSERPSISGRSGTT